MDRVSCHLIRCLCNRRFEVFVRPCPACGHQEFRRLPREGVIERSVLPLLGLFPWECRICQRKIYMRLRGEKRLAERPTH